MLVIHDFADIFLESAKLAHYAKLTTLCDCIFAFFAIRYAIFLESAKLAHYAKVITLCDCIFAFFNIR